MFKDCKFNDYTVNLVRTLPFRPPDSVACAQCARELESLQEQRRARCALARECREIALTLTRCSLSELITAARKRLHELWDVLHIPANLRRPEFEAAFAGALSPLALDALASALH